MSELAERAEAYLRDLTPFPDRHVGGPGNRAATELFASTVARFGFGVSRRDFDCIEWEFGEAVLEVDGDVRCMPPDLICILDPATGEPIRTDIVRYGYRGAVVAIPAHERMRTELGIKTFGPRYFGYDRDYVPVEELMTG